jgi:hypothetical protein
MAAQAAGTQAMGTGSVAAGVVGPEMRPLQSFEDATMGAMQATRIASTSLDSPHRDLLNGKELVCRPQRCNAPQLKYWHSQGSSCRPLESRQLERKREP